MNENLHWQLSYLLPWRQRCIYGSNIFQQRSYIKLLSIYKTVSPSKDFKLQHSNLDNLFLFLKFRIWTENPVTSGPAVVILGFWAFCWSFCWGFVGSLGCVPLLYLKMLSAFTCFPEFLVIFVNTFLLGHTYSSQPNCYTIQFHHYNISGCAKRYD